MISIQRDVIVVGAGPAGAICAAYLAKSGIDVLLLDKEIFPRDKACGDLLQEGVVKHVDALGAFDALDKMGACIRKIQIMSNNGNKAQIPFECYCAPRLKFDELMVKTAVRHGAEFRHSCRVTDVIKENDEVKGVKIKYRGEESEIKCKILIAADGAYSHIASSVGASKEKSSSVYIGQRAYFKGIKLDRAYSKHQYDTYGLFCFDESIKPEYFWIVPCGQRGASEGYCNVGMMIKDRDAYGNKSLQERFNDWIKGNDEICKMFEEAEQVSPWAGGKLSDNTQQIKATGNGYILIGDAASAMLPMYNDGLSAAANTAKAAAIVAALAVDKGKTDAAFLEIAMDEAMKPYEISENETKERSLMSESLYDVGTMDNIVEHINRDPVYLKKITKKMMED